MKTIVDFIFRGLTSFNLVPIFLENDDRNGVEVIVESRSPNLEKDIKIATIEIKGMECGGIGVELKANHDGSMPLPAKFAGGIATPGVLGRIMRKKADEAQKRAVVKVTGKEFSAPVNRDTVVELIIKSISNGVVSVFATVMFFIEENDLCISSDKWQEVFKQHLPLL